MILILPVTLGYLPPCVELVSLSITTCSRTKRCSGRKGAPTSEQAWPSLPSRHCRWGHRAVGEGWTAYSRSPSLFCLNHRPLLLNHIVLVSFTDLSATLPLLFDSGIFYAPHLTELMEGWEQIPSWTPISTIVWLVPHYFHIFPAISPPGRGKVAAGNWLFASGSTLPLPAPPLCPRPRLPQPSGSQFLSLHGSPRRPV